MRLARRRRICYFIAMRVIIRSSPINAAGVFALEPIPSGARVLEYTGPRLRHEDADELYKDRPYTYLFGYGDGASVIDGYAPAMYVNHSCAANCETIEDEDERIWITAIRDIAPGEELCYDYFLYEGEGEAPCTCGSPKCRGTMYSPAEIRKRRRAARAAAQPRTKNSAKK
jgi:hypothetical protein